MLPFRRAPAVPSPFAPIGRTNLRVAFYKGEVVSLTTEGESLVSLMEFLARLLACVRILLPLRSSVAMQVKCTVLVGSSDTNSSCSCNFSRSLYQPVVASNTYAQGGRPMSNLIQRIHPFTARIIIVWFPCAYSSSVYVSFV